MKIIKKIILCSLLFFIDNNCFASVSEKINSLISNKTQAKTKYSIAIANAQTGEIIYSHNSDMLLSPASNMKLLTSFTALKYLGREFNFATTAYIKGNSLMITGSGDPLLGVSDGNDFIADIINMLKKRNISEVNGIFIDSSVFDDNRVNENWPPAQLNRSYACQVSGLNYNANCIRIQCSKSKDRIALTTVPQTDYLTLLNKVSLLSKGDSAIGSYRTEVPNKLIVHGKCNRPASFDVAIERPAAFFGFILAENLQKAGIATVGTLAIGAFENENLEIIAEHKTSIIEVLKYCNKNSFNLAAECLLKTLGARLVNGGRNGSWQSGRTAVGEYLGLLGTQKNFNIVDGCGLSSANKISSAILLAVLQDAYKSDLWSIFRSTLACGGVDGTLRKYFYQKNYKGRIFAKTGYINGVRALSGACQTDNGTYLFSILANSANYKSKSIIYNIAKAVIDENQK